MGLAGEYIKANLSIRVNCSGWRICKPNTRPQNGHMQQLQLKVRGQCSVTRSAGFSAHEPFISLSVAKDSGPDRQKGN